VYANLLSLQALRGRRPPGPPIAKSAPAAVQWHLGDTLVGSITFFAMFAVSDVSLAVNLWTNFSFYRASAYWRIARQHTDARYWYSKSVCLSVRNVPVSDENGLTYHHSFSPYGSSPIILFYQHETSSRNSDEVTPCRGAKCRSGIKISRFSTNKSLYLANDARYRHSYYRRRIGNRTQAIE